MHYATAEIKYMELGIADNTAGDLWFYSDILMS